MDRLIYENEITNDVQPKKYKKPAFNVNNPKKTYINVDDALIYVGDNSKYFKIIILIFSFYSIIMSFITMGWIIFMGESDYYCKSNNTDILYNKCSKQEACSYNLNQNYISKRINIINYFNLYCDKEYFIYWSNVLYFLAILIGGFTLSFISDIKGRKLIINISCILICSGLIICIFSYMIQFWIFGIFLVGLGFGGLENIILVYISEVSALNFRANATSIINITWGIAQILIAIMSKYIYNWKYIFLYVFLTPMLIFSILSYFYILESPRYLVIKKRFKECRKIFKKISLINNRPPFRFKLYGEIPEKNNEYDNFYKLSKSNNKRISRRKKSKTIRAENNIKYSINLLIFALIWFISRIIYLSSNIVLPSESSNFFFNFSLLGIAEFCSGLFSAKIKKKFKRKNSILFCLIISGILCLIQSYLIFIDIINFIIKFLVTLANSILILYTIEYFPTNIRSKSLALCLISNRIGSLFLSFYLYLINSFNIQNITGLSILIFTFAFLTLFIKKHENINIHEEIYEDISWVSIELISRSNYK